MYGIFKDLIKISSIFIHDYTLSKKFTCSEEKYFFFLILLPI